MHRLTVAAAGRAVAVQLLLLVACGNDGLDLAAGDACQSGVYTAASLAGAVRNADDAAVKARSEEEARQGWEEALRSATRSDEPDLQEMAEQWGPITDPFIDEHLAALAQWCTSRGWKTEIRDQVRRSSVRVAARRRPAAYEAARESVRRGTRWPRRRSLTMVPSAHRTSTSCCWRWFQTGDVSNAFEPAMIADTYHLRPVDGDWRVDSTPNSSGRLGAPASRIVADCARTGGTCTSPAERQHVRHRRPRLSGPASIR